MPAIAHNFSTDAGNVSALRTAYPAFVVEQAGHNGPLLLLCEHASAHVPSIYDGLGLSDDERHRHIGWDIGALALAQGLASALASPLVYATQSRLLMDLNRDPAASDAMPACSDQLQIPGNVAVSNIERVRRQQWLYNHFTKPSMPFEHRDLGADWRLQWSRFILLRRRCLAMFGLGTWAYCRIRIGDWRTHCWMCCGASRTCVSETISRMHRNRASITVSTGTVRSMDC